MSEEVVSTQVERATKVTSQVLKAAVISYFRFKKQMVAVDEVSCCFGSCDVLADDGKQVIEIEVKLSKSDLVRGEARKGKHPLGKAGGWPFDTGSQWKGIPNRFYLCVPEGIADAAEEWILKTHPSYGLIVFLEKELWRLERGSVVFWGEALHFRRGAKKLHNEYRDSVWRAICKRASASLCTLMGYRAVQVSKHNEGKV